MALRVWLPLNGNLENKGLSDIGQPTINNLTLQESGKIGKAYRGAALYHLKEDFLQNKWTIAAWVNNNYQWGTYNDIILSKNDATSSDAQFYLSVVGGTKLNIGINLHSQQYEYSYTFQTNVWYHVAAAYDGANYYLYLNGDLVKTGADTSSYTTPALNFTINGRSQSSAGSLYSQYKLINDVRVYDECLSQKQIKEISKGLVAHYKLDNPYIETVTNLAPGLNATTSYSTNNSPSWDTTLNGTPMITPNGWVSGYNAGVTDPTHGYHAHWVRENSQWLMMFPNLNSIISQKGRWEGISGSVSTKDILAGEKYTISWWQKTDNLNLAAWGGIYYKKTSDGTMNFWDSCPTLGYNTKLNTWQFMYKTFTRSSEYVQHDGGQSIYVYGGSSNEGTMYVKDVQIVRGDHPLPYAVGTRNGQNYEADCSGNGYTVIKNGTLTFNSDSARYSGSTTFGGTCADYLYRDRFTWLTSPFTFNCWIYQTSATSPSGSNTGNTLQFIMSQGRDCGYAGFALCSANGYARLYLGTATSGTYYSIDDNTINLLNGWHMLTGTFDGATAKLYVDGIQKATKDSAVDPSWEQTTCFALGKMSYNATSSTTTYFPFVGSISEAKIYATALSAEDILTMYKNSGIIDNKGNVYAYEFKEE